MFNQTSIHDTCYRRCSTWRPSIAMHPSALRQRLWRVCMYVCIFGFKGASTSKVIGARNDDWLWWPNDIRGPCGPKASWHSSYRWGKTPKNPHPGNLSRPGIEPGPAAWQAHMLPTCSTARLWSYNIFSSMFTLSVTEVDSQPYNVGHYGQVYISQKVCISGPMFIRLIFLNWVLSPPKIFDTSLTTCRLQGILYGQEDNLSAVADFVLVLSFLQGLDNITRTSIPMHWSNLQDEVSFFMETRSSKQWASLNWIFGTLDWRTTTQNVIYVFINLRVCPALVSGHFWQIWFIEHQMIPYMYDLRSIFCYEYIHHYTSFYY